MKQNKENFFVPTGAYTKPTERSNQNIKQTNAPLGHIEYTGVAKDTVNLQNTNDDYGKANVVVYDNERNNYETKNSCN